MKTKALFSSTLAAVLLAAGSYTATAQSTTHSSDVPRSISYQGVLADNNGTALPDGNYQITLTLYADPTGSVPLWQDTYNTHVAGGLFNLYIGNGNTPLPDIKAMNTSLWIGTKVGNAPEMYPLTPLSASPYALNVPDRAITTGKLADKSVTADKVDMNYIAGVQINDQQIAGTGTVLKLKGSDAITLNYDATTNSVTIGAGNGTAKANSGDAEKGNDILATNYLTSNNWLGKDGGANLPFYDVPDGAASIYNTLAGGYANVVRINADYSTVAGGYRNEIDTGSDYGHIGGGYTNRIDGNYGAIGGGINNVITSNNSVIGGGNGNTVTGFEATIGGGGTNKAYGNGATIAGGTSNEVSRVLSSIVGGIDNTVSGDYSFIGGGTNNTVAGNYSAIVIGGDYSFPSSVAGNYSLIGAGLNNTIGLGSNNAIVAGGRNEIHDYTEGSIIGAGFDNNIYSAGSFIGAGLGNQIFSGSDYSAITAGNQNETSGNYTFIGGGEENTISGDYSAVAGGNSNDITGLSSFIGGGGGNTISDNSGVIGGGLNNLVSNDYGVIGGGADNVVSGRDAVIGGGEKNLASGNFSAVGGGYRNNAVGNFSTVGGGIINWAANDNATVGGGYGNFASGLTSTIPGGDSLQTPSYAQTAIGFYNAPRGFVPTRPATTTARTAINAPLFMVGNGVPNLIGSGVTRSNAFEVSYNGHSVVYDVNGSSNIALFGHRNPIRGATYIDNVLYSWGEVDAAGNVNADFGVASVTHVGPGTYIVRIALESPLGAAIVLNNASITATVVDKEGDPEATCRLISSTKIAGNQFTIRTKDLSCHLVDTPFMFKVAGRP